MTVNRLCIHSLPLRLRDKKIAIAGVVVLCERGFNMDELTGFADEVLKLDAVDVGPLVAVLLHHGHTLQ